MENLENTLDETQVLELLKELNQLTILKEYEGRSSEERQELISQINRFETVLPGGLRDYIKRSKHLLLNSKNSVNPYNDYTPSIPQGAKITIGDDKFHHYEALGMNELMHTGFVLVAGGLGERLGYDGIKIGIPVDLITKRTYMEVYTDYIKAYEKWVRKQCNLPETWYIPLCIMTSDDTYSKTLELLKANKNYGLFEHQIEIVKQEQVPAILDNDCNMALRSDSKFLIETKPHGHGDVHTLLHQSGIAQKWLKNFNKKWLVFFQDTNALIFNTVPSFLGVSQENEFVVNSLTIPRKPGDAVGAICQLTNSETNKTITLNVEYNQLDPLLKSKYNQNGDVANEEGLSNFPGNTNVLLFELSSYVENLERTKGITPEFVNPKYADEERSKFKSAVRLETMMQDYPLLLQNNEKVGFTMYPRWFAFSTCKNALKEGIEKWKKNSDPETAFSAERNLFIFNENILKIMNKLTVIEDENHKRTKVTILGEEVDFGPKILIYPSFGFTLKMIENNIKGHLTVTVDSTMILKGKENTIGDLYVDGFAVPQPGDTKIENGKKIHYRELKEGEGEKFEIIRGYTIQEN
jgi:UDP-sugar pyrophosphorylase